ncbi:MAG TPA: hypothetical protein VEJ89_13665 [Myxococcaceae bacterium]|nr:hypothetical protein [Myxococcaceae bacterium]
MLRLALAALLLALCFDALSTALVWDLVRSLTGTARRSAIHAVRPVDVRESRHAQAPPSPDATPEP